MSRFVAYLSLAIVAFTVMLIGEACTVNKSLSGKNISYLYKSETALSVVDYSVFNRDKKSIVYVRLSASSFGQSWNEEGSSSIDYSVRYKVFRNYSDPIAIDSGRFTRSHLAQPGLEKLNDSLIVSTIEGYTYVIEVSIKDLNSALINRQFVEISRAGNLGNHDLLVYDKRQYPQFKTYLQDADSFTVVTNKPLEKLYARYYDRDFPPASPPFSVVTPKPFDFTPNEIIRLKAISSKQYYLPITKTGFYHLAADSTDRDGATLFFFGSFYPKAKTLLDLVQPLRYITTNEEFESLHDGGNLKQSVDAYWLRVGGNPDRARELIKAFYSRVEYANEFFASYLPGWKSDRGMCYIVYGPPDLVYRSTSTETWVYGEEGKYNSLSLTFTRVVNPFTRNDFRLNRGVHLKASWYRAVEFWRQGRVLTYR